ncbi:TonB-dependent receptor [Dokdonia sinensis]|uniref:TonB-dependent receptor n=1 Tax=Dokdonia sinensis TaxID=2479847 RepID=A0A3M0GR31_9FLAO|nr:TonB-dependent receptor [Dokdonia sinensis]RMB64163.1 TonB-dependent receptor [Dokdonia sinensis]
MKKIFSTLLLLLPVIAFAQQTVTGTITDENDTPLLGASVLENGTTNGVVTDFDGNFTINVGRMPAYLTVSYLGYTSIEVKVESTTTPVSIVLEENAEQLAQVVVIGYGEVNRRDVTGAITTIDPKRDNVAVNPNIEGILQGRAAGVQITNNGTEPGAPSSVSIRGINSLTGNTQPLYVIDGVIVDSATEDTFDPLSGGSSYLAPQGGITGINPQDIESIQVLKDASATAIYGSRGANGVIIITTKRGKAGETKYSFSSTVQIGRLTNNIDVLDTAGYVQYQNEVRANQDFDPKFFVYPDGTYAEFQMDEAFMLANSETIPRLTPVDWSDDTYRTAITTNNRISIYGGGEKNKFYFAGGHLKNEGIVPRAFAKRTDFTMNLDNTLSRKLELTTKIGASYLENSASKGTDNLGGTNNNLVRQIISGAPFENFDENNDGLDFTEVIDGPQAWIEDYDDLSNELRLLGALTLDYKISEVFKYRARIGTDFRNKERSIWYGTNIFRGRQANGEAGISTLERFRYNIDNTLMFKKKFNKNHKLDGTVGTTWDQSTIKRTANQASDFPNQDLRADGISFGQVQQVPFFDKQQESIVSFLGRLNYTLYNKYLFTATYRADGSSKFARGERFGHFPAVAFAWKLNKEKFLRKSESLSDLKVRVGWGLTGNQSIPNYRTLTPYGPTQTPYSDDENNPLTAIIPTNLANPDLTWETTSQYNAGIDFGFLNDRFTGTIDVYHKEITDLLLNVEIGPSTGFENYFANQGDLTNKGIEFAINADIIDNDNFTWNVFGNLSVNRNEIGNLGIPPATFGNATYSAFLGRQVSGGNFFKTPANIFIEGEAPALFYGFATDGIISSEEELANAPSFRGNPAQLGDVAIIDQNGDGDITDSDLTIIGDPNPDFTYGFGSQASYKGVSLSFFFNGVEGNDIANGNLLREGYADNNGNNIRTEAYENAYRADNPNGTFPRVGYDLADETGFTDRIVEDGSFLRLSNITLGYQLPLGDNSPLDSAYFSVSGQNLWLITDYSGFDPEVNSFSFDPGRVGIDWNSFPNTKRFSFALNLTF